VIATTPSSSEIEAVMARTVFNVEPDAHFIPIPGLEPTTVSDGAGGTLTAVTGVLSSTVDGKGHLVFFWHNDGFVGWSLDHRVFTAEVKSNGDTAIEVDYRWLRPGEAVACCASGFQAVTYRWNGTSVQPDVKLSAEIGSGLSEVHVVSAAPEILARAVPEWNGTLSFREDGSLAADGFDAWLGAHSTASAEAAARTLLGTTDGSAETTSSDDAAIVVLTVEVADDDSVAGTRFEMTFDVKDNRPISLVRASWAQRCARGGETDIFLPRPCP
jgi:hypothetical protein